MPDTPSTPQTAGRPDDSPMGRPGDAAAASPAAGGEAAAWTAADEELLQRGRRQLRKQLEQIDPGVNTLTDVPMERRGFRTCLEAVRACGMALADVPMERRDVFVCEAAVERDMRAVAYVPARLRPAMLRKIIGTMRAGFLLHENLSDAERRVFAADAARNGLRLVNIPPALRSLEVYVEALLARGCRQHDVPEALRARALAMAAATREARTAAQVRANNMRAERERLAGIAAGKKAKREAPGA